MVTIQYTEVLLSLATIVIIIINYFTSFLEQSDLTYRNTHAQIFFALSTVAACISYSAAAVLYLAIVVSLAIARLQLSYPTGNC